MTGDEVYGQDPRLRTLLEARQVGYVLVIAGTLRVRCEGVDWQAAAIAAHVPDDHWHLYSAGNGAKGHRCYAWAWTRIDTHRPGHRWLLIRRNLTTGELAFYRCYAPRPTPLAALVRIAGIRWAVEKSFQAAKGDAAIRPPPADATTSADPNHDLNVSLEY